MSVRATAWALVWSCWSCFAAAASTAAAQPIPPASSGRVRLEVTSCPTVATEGVRRVLSVEIGDLLVADGSGDAGEVDTLIIRCAGDLAFVVATGGGEPPIARTFPLGEFPGNAAPRALALLGVELLAARSAAVRERIMGRQDRAVSATAAAASVAPGPAPPPTASPRDIRIGVAGVGRKFGTSGGGPALGGQVEATATALKGALIDGDLEIAARQRDVAGVGQTAAWLVSGAASFGIFAARRRWRAAVGLGARVGLVRESGASADPAHIRGATFTRPWGGPMVSARLSAAVGRVGLTVSGEAGWSLSSIDETAAGATAISVGGPWLALSIGADFRVR